LKATYFIDSGFYFILPFMLQKTNWNFKHIFSVIVIIILVVPYTRKPLQLGVQKIIAQIPPSIQPKDERRSIASFNWELMDLNNRIFQLNSSKGKIRIVSFWASWCPPCVAELPSLQKLYNAYKNEVEFVFISNENPETVEAFLKANHYNFPVYKPLHISEEIYFNPKTIPRTLLINKSDEIIMIEDGASNWFSDKVKETINRLLKNNVVQ
jgi:thiol-disulfide isomerase/thioredoxin